MAVAAIRLRDIGVCCCKTTTNIQYQVDIINKKIAGESIVVPTALHDKKVEYSVYTLNSILLEKKNIDSGMKIKLDGQLFYI